MRNKIIGGVLCLPLVALLIYLCYVSPDATDIPALEIACLPTAALASMLLAVYGASKITNARKILSHWSYNENIELLANTIPARSAINSLSDYARIFPKTWASIVNSSPTVISKQYNALVVNYTDQSGKTVSRVFDGVSLVNYENRDGDITGFD